MKLNVNSVCFTGHRPEKMPQSKEAVDSIKHELSQMIMTYVAMGYDTFYTGMQRGIDLWAAEIVVELKKEFNLKLIAVYPFRNMCFSYKGEYADIVKSVEENATSTVVLAESYFEGCYSVRNKYLVDNSSVVIAVVSDYNSGTGQTIAYAKKKGLTLEVIEIGDIINGGYEQLEF